MYTKRDFNQKFKKDSATFYKNIRDMRTALFATIDVLKAYAEGMNNKTTPTKDSSFSLIDGGYVLLSDIVQYLKSKYPELNYINRNHIVELYFQDRDHKILINGEDQIKYKIVTYVQPPDILYFGTLANLAERMVESGIKSHTKKYIKLYDTPEGAKEFAEKFASRESDKIVVLSINTKQAFEDGFKFSTYKTGEFIIVRVDPIYILE